MYDKDKNSERSKIIKKAHRKGISYENKTS